MSNNVDLTQTIQSAWLESARDAAPSASVPRDAASSDVQMEWVNDEALKLVHQIFLPQAQDPPRSVVFAGVDHGNGCSHVSAAVAETLARASRKSVCLVEANFRSPGLPGLFGSTNRQGLSDALLAEGPIRSFARPVVNDKVWLLSAGSANSHSDLLSSVHLSARLSELRAEFDFVIIDAPPLGPYADAAALGRLSDGIVIIIEADATRKQSALVVAANLRASGVPILGAVLNKRKFPIPGKLYNRL